MAKKFEFAPLQATKVEKKEAKVDEPKKAVKVAAKVPSELHDHLVSYCFYNYSTHEEVITQALQAFFLDKEYKPLPDKIRNRPRPGRKRTNSNKGPKP